MEVYLRNAINVTTWSDLNISDSDVEALNISCKLGYHKRLNLTAVYRPPGGNVQSALDKIELMVNTIKLSSSGHTLITCDLNIDLTNDNAHTRKVLQFSNLCQVKQLIDQPTRLTSNSSSLIDHIYTNSPHCSLSGIIDCNESDHFPVFCVLKKTRDVTQYREVTGRSIRDLDTESFKHDVEQIDADIIFADENPDLIWGEIILSHNPSY